MSCKKRWTRAERRSAMAIALDTSVLVAWEKAGGLPAFIAATVMSRKDELLAIDADYDRLKDRLKLVSF